ncbi:hypothetical protein Krac_5572 [Ktedonobacter racemifer DSM 44963]|uniref:Uncharacterized protein n=1 Tax=Ktedonobacter racemifer DSM 44963 TaxID=485913 RepID=D6TWC5_KTERA|nr:hypothetical protein Krac_5572 [Ktedonobacter racemifer DSM 44963]
MGQFSPSEVTTILIHFHQSHYRMFKAYYRNPSENAPVF